MSHWAFGNCQAGVAGIRSMQRGEVKEPERNAAYRHISMTVPALGDLLAATGRVPLPPANDEPVAHALVRIVAGQMLSRTAAQAILSRLAEAARQSRCGPVYRLPEAQLVAAGLSRRKARTIQLIAHMADTETERLESWRQLPFQDLRSEVSSVWGMSDWSASVLAIFHFGQPDVVPLSDGSLVRAIRLAEQIIGEQIAHEACSPYRSYLAMTLWAALDEGHLIRRSDRSLAAE